MISLTAPAQGQDPKLIDDLSPNSAAGATHSPNKRTTKDEIIDIHAPKTFVPEGSIIKILKPEIWVQFLPMGELPEETLPKMFKPTHNVSSIKGRDVSWYLNYYRECMAQ